MPFQAPGNRFRTAVKQGIENSLENMVTALQQRGVACFSAKVDDILRWSHYADGHRGSCLEFDTGLEPFSKAR